MVYNLPRGTAFGRWREKARRCPKCSHGARMETYVNLMAHRCAHGHTTTDQELYEMEHA